MLSYQHGYHAGNHADIIKHLCWVAVINRLKQKNKPFNLFDTHAGAGCYRLDSEQALKTGEFQSGIARLDNITAQDPLLQDYLRILSSYSSDNQYPGSPLIASHLLREQDALHVMELHPGEFDALKQSTRQYRAQGQVHCHFRDGLAGLVALSPPQPNRGAVLIDPPYESRSEYQQVINTVKQCLKRWPQAQLLVWYPLLSARAGDKEGAGEAMCHTFGELNNNVLQIELRVTKNTPDAGMFGSGVCFINPAWQVETLICPALEEVLEYLGEDSEYSVNWLNNIDS
ncbi:23S rRNA (adenine(2030)-N(6))-methyltransferase RlmJ [Alteromonas gilva]|uniref:Ribosomal RNA large subunit methyltransferase J n=1 Tax=Alteromonas gilva TaxID=2987522 RepID=A0ABT5L1W9_9ALTE|nr:23S rRNA (adenine(2030)-N(6))-methyltransferase RlmJ [Alteromonas gilva]MDC8831030.1 23S rRNA (adenine(2030)-N(6))-methyltransferase RlmJ [Alteromonas gilva]